MPVVFHWFVSSPMCLLDISHHLITHELFIFGRHISSLRSLLLHSPITVTTIPIPSHCFSFSAFDASLTPQAFHFRLNNTCHDPLDDHSYRLQFYLISNINLCYLLYISTCRMFSPILYVRYIAGYYIRLSVVDQSRQDGLISFRALIFSRSPQLADTQILCFTDNSICKPSRCRPVSSTCQEC